MHPSTINARDIEEASSQHFRACDDEKALDFIEWIFGAQYYTAGQHGVDAINEVFRQEGVGYELSPFTVTRTPIGKGQYGGQAIRTTVQLPEVIVKTNEVMHSTTVMPALKLLSGKNWQGANTEMLKAHEHLREGNFDDAIHWAGKCLESVLQIICDKKNWKFVPDKDTLNPLLQACYKGKLFDAPYIEVIQKSSGELRNKYGGHGKAVSAHGHADLEMAEHMIQITSAHVLFLSKRSGIN